MKKLATFAAVLVLAGCASTSDMGTSEMKSMGNMDFDSLVKEAKASLKKAASVGSEWRDSGKFLKKAQAAAKAGDMEKALKLAKKAKDQGDMGAAQGESQKNAGPWLF